MFEISDFLNKKANYSTGIQKCPTGIYTLVGNVPDELTHEETRGFYKNKVSNYFKTEQEAIDSLLNIGIKRFQLANCEWYGEI